MDTIPWGLLKVQTIIQSVRFVKVSVDTIPWGLLKVKDFGGYLNDVKFQWILFLGAYLKVSKKEMAN